LAELVCKRNGYADRQRHSRTITICTTAFRRFRFIATYSVQGRESLAARMTSNAAGGLLKLYKKSRGRAPAVFVPNHALIDCVRVGLFPVCACSLDVIPSFVFCTHTRPRLLH
jgi:hypothetical protein